MQSTDVYRLISRRAKRGLIVFSILWIGSIIACVGALTIPDCQSWAVTAFFASVLFYLGFIHVRKNNGLAWQVSENPQTVYWAQPDKSSRGLKDFELLTLHFRNGQQLEIQLPTSKMSGFITWLTERNPTVRLGNYD